MVITVKAVESDLYKNKVWLLLEELSINFNDIKLYILSFIHRSIVNERNDFTPEHNERLEFLWDAVLELVITQSLFADFPKKQEWDLTDMRSTLVRGKNLSLVAKALGFNEYLFLWKWEEKSWWRDNDYILANTLEAFIWALFIDLWFETSKKFILEHIYSTLPENLEQSVFKDYKTLLQEYSQAHEDITPTYRVINESGPDHDKVFLVWVYLWNKKIWEWTGSSKKKSQEAAAANAYNNINT